MCGQEVSVANKSEYIWEGYVLRKSLKGLRYNKQKKGTECFAKFIKRIRRSLKKCTTSVVCVSNEIWFTAKINKVTLIFYQPSKEVIVPWAQSPQQFFLQHYPWLICPRWVCAADLGWWPYIHPLEFWTGCLFGLWRLLKSSPKSQFGYQHFFAQVFSTFLSLKSNLTLYAKWSESGLQNKVSWLKKGREMNNATTHTLF